MDNIDEEPEIELAQLLEEVLGWDSTPVQTHPQNDDPLSFVPSFEAEGVLGDDQHGLSSTADGVKDVKGALNKSIKLKMAIEGKSLDDETEDARQPQTQLSKEEQEKQEKRKKKNRLSAEKSRQKKKENELRLKEKSDHNEMENERLRLENVTLKKKVVDLHRLLQQMHTNNKVKIRGTSDFLEKSQILLMASPTPETEATAAGARYAQECQVQPLDFPSSHRRRETQETPEIPVAPVSQSQLGQAASVDLTVTSKSRYYQYHVEPGLQVPNLSSWDALTEMLGNFESGQSTEGYQSGTGSGNQVLKLKAGQPSVAICETGETYSQPSVVSEETSGVNPQPFVSFNGNNHLYFQSPGSDTIFQARIHQADVGNATGEDHSKSLVKSNGPGDVYSELSVNVSNETGEVNSYPTGTGTALCFGNGELYPQPTLESCTQPLFTIVNDGYNGIYSSSNVTNDLLAPPPIGNDVFPISPVVVVPGTGENIVSNPVLAAASSGGAVTDEPMVPSPCQPTDNIGSGQNTDKGTGRAHFQNAWSVGDSVEDEDCLRDLVNGFSDPMWSEPPPEKKARLK